MAMYLSECPVYTIMLIGHWLSNAFLWYIQKQVVEFSHNVSKKMLRFKNYMHVPNYDHRIVANDPRVCNNPNNAEMEEYWWRRVMAKQAPSFQTIQLE